MQHEVIETLGNANKTGFAAQVSYRYISVNRRFEALEIGKYVL